MEALVRSRSKNMSDAIKDRIRKELQALSEATVYMGRSPLYVYIANVAGNA